jgi:hypothetical protein
MNYVDIDGLLSYTDECAAEMGLELNYTDAQHEWDNGPRYTTHDFAEYGSETHLEGAGETFLYASGFKFTANDGVAISGRFTKPVMVCKADHSNGLYADNSGMFERDALAHAVNAVAGCPLFVPYQNAITCRRFMDIREGL